MCKYSLGVYLLYFLCVIKPNKSQAGKNETELTWNLLGSLPSDCGRRQIILSSRGFFGTEIEHGEAPWNAALVHKKDGLFCGATLISSKFVISAAHCFLGKYRAHKYEKKEFLVYLGAHNISASYETGRVSYVVIALHIHTDWIPEFTNYDADIAILELQHEVNFHRFIQPICLSKPGTPTGTIKHGYVTGFGASEREIVENIARRIETPFLNYKNCVDQQALLSHRAFCGGYANGTGVCSGDSGSALIVEHNGRHYLRGIVSVASVDSIGQCELKKYSVFTDIHGFYSWILTGELLNIPTERPRTIPKINQLQPSYILKKGTNFEIVCNATSVPCPEIVWSKKENQIAVNALQIGNKLRITNITAENSGDYECIATNTEGSDRAVVHLDVDRREPPVVDFFGRKQPRILVGESIRIKCKVISGFPSPTITWMRQDRTPISSRVILTKPDLLILNEASLDDAGVYECRAVNSVSETSKLLKLKVWQLPTLQMFPDTNNFNLTEGDELKLKCVATGSPRPTIDVIKPANAPEFQMQKFSEPLDLQSELLISHSNVSVNHSGKYECIAVNDAGQVNRHINVFVKQNQTLLKDQFINDGSGVLAFEDDSYAAYDARLEKLMIEIKFRLESDQDGIIFYAADSNHNPVKFISLVIKDKQLQFRFKDSKRKRHSTKIIINKFVELNEWIGFLVEQDSENIVRYFRLYFEISKNTVNYGPYIVDIAKFETKTLFYVGGYDKKISLHRDVGVIESFKGCIGDLEIGGHKFDMVSNARELFNVHNCHHEIKTINIDYEDVAYEDGEVTFDSEDQYDLFEWIVND